MGLAGEVEDDVDRVLGEKGEHGLPIGDVGAAGRAIGDDDVIATLAQVRDEEGADEAGPPGDQCPHGAGVGTGGCWYGSRTSR